MGNQKGFTLIELAIVITILGILAIVIIPKYQDLTSEAKKAANQGVLGGVKSGVYIYYAKHLGKFPGLTLGGTGADSVLTEMPFGWFKINGTVTGTDSTRLYKEYTAADTASIWYFINADSTVARFSISGTNMW